jgi:very-short-patch-repair endonuclease
MNTTLLITLIAAILMGLAMALIRGKGGKAPQVKAKPFLTANESEFLQRLEAAVPEYRFHAQVAMGALLDPAVARAGNGRDYMRIRGMFSQKIVDFVAQRRDTGQIVAIIELDDRTHDKARDARRDAMLQQAGYRTVRWQSKHKPGTAEILAALVAPPAPAQPASSGVRAELLQQGAGPQR